MFLTDVWIQIAIIAGIIVVFLLACYFNWKTKAPKDVDIPDHCLSCQSKTCMIKQDDVIKQKEQLKKYLEECEENTNE